MSDRDEEATDEATLGVLTALVRLQRPSVCVEAGTYKGHGSVAIARALRSNGRGVLFTADIADHGAEEKIAEARLSKWVEFCTLDFSEMLEAIGGLVDFAYIDASGPGHPRDSSIRWTHFEAARERLNPGGLICTHDTASEGWSDNEARKHIVALSNLNLRYGKGLSIYHD